MKKNIVSLLLVIVSSLASYTALADDGTINSVNIVQDTLKGVPNCMHYKIIGLCFWLKCSTVECHVETTLKIDQYLPDAVVSVYTKPTSNPWWYAQHIADPVFSQAGKTEIENTTHFNMGFGDEHDNSNHDINNKFHEVDIIGNPALAFLSGYDVMLPSAATPYVPYYSSLMDAYAWRFPGLERFYPGSLIPGLHEVGTLVLHDWGPVYPRNGYVNQPNDAKAAAVDALRASTIVTATGQPHLYIPLSSSCGKHCYASPVKENSKDAQYQMIYPKTETQCTVFGGSDVASLQSWEADASIKGHDRYVWILWRHYHGCIPVHHAKYLGSINF
jgi:integrating conjugative element protein (TIGR03756 family)